jgi:hypothetical protein
MRNVLVELNPTMIILIFKSKNQSKTNNWCPITKVLSIKLQTFLETNIRPMQIGFVGGGT